MCFTWSGEIQLEIELKVKWVLIDLYEESIQEFRFF